jgi:hypothetical protein
MNMFKKLSLCILAFAMVSCAPVVKGLKKDPSYTFERISASQVCPVGVVHTTQKLSKEKMISSVSQLQAAIIDGREDVKVSTVSMVTALGDDEYYGILKDYRANGALTAEQIGKMKEAAEEANFFIFARILADDVKNKREKKKDKENPDVTEVKTEAKRKIQVMFHVFDGEKQKEVWSGIMETTQDTKARYVDEKDSGLIGLVKNIAGTADNRPDDQKFPYPEPPTLDSLLERIFKDFARTFPEEEKKK